MSSEKETSSNVKAMEEPLYAADTSDTTSIRSLIAKFRWPRPAFLLGLFFIVLVAWIWAASSMLAQYLYDDPSACSPFLLTYIGVALFAMLLPMKHLTDRLNVYGSSECAAEPCTPVPIDTSNEHEYDLVTPYQKIAMAGFPDDDSISSRTGHSFKPDHWTHLQHIRAAIQIAPVWMIANWAYNAALAQTSIASSTVLASMCSVFSLGLAIFTGDEQFSFWKAVGCALGIAGTILTAAHDWYTPDGDPDGCAEACQDALMGDLLALAAAFGFSVNAIQFRLLCPKNEELYSMQLLLGYMGLINLIFWSPYAIYKLALHINMPFVVFTLVVLRGLFDYVISEYLHFRAVVLTNATVASVGLGLTIPMAFGADFFIGATNIATPLSLLGALAVLASFVVVVVDTADHDHHQGGPNPHHHQHHVHTEAKMHLHEDQKQQQHHHHHHLQESNDQTLNPRLEIEVV